MTAANRFNDLVQEVRALSVELGGLFHRADALLAPRPEITKQVPFQVSMALTFLNGDFSAKTAAFVNGGDDVYLTRFGCGVRMVRAYVAPLRGNQLKMTPQQQGFYPSDVQQTGITPAPFFDFEWNYQVASTNSFYGSSANNVPMLSRGSLGNTDLGEGLTFTQPGQLLRAGDTLTFFVKPTLFYIPGLDPTDAVHPYDGSYYVVDMFAVGRRGGVMAEADYEIR